MAPGMRRKVKPVIELMEAMPTVILGFFAGLFLAPYVEGHLPGIFSLLMPGRRGRGGGGGGGAGPVGLSQGAGYRPPGTDRTSISRLKIPGRCPSTYGARNRPAKKPRITVGIASINSITGLTLRRMPGAMK